MLRWALSKASLRLLAGGALALLMGCGGLEDGRSDAGDQDAGSVLIRGATVVDGTGAPGRTADVRMTDGHIVEVGTVEPEPNDEVVDAAGLVLAPGFIDTHSHHDDGLLEAPEARAAVSQGITTIVVGQDGGSFLPLDSMFRALEASPAAVNVASYVGHGTLRLRVMGDDFRREATEGEVDQMSALLAQELDAGGLGLSTGLEYDPGIYSSTAEVVTLARVTAAQGGRYISHIRSEDRRFFEAVEETVRIAEEADLPVQISHMKLAMRSLWGRAGEALALLDAARARGLRITADVYPYEYWQSTMTVLFPDRDYTDREAARFALEELAPPEGILIGRFDARPDLVGMSLSEVAEAWETDAVSAYLELIAESQAHGEETGDPGESIVATSMTFDDIATLLSWEHTNVSSDGALRGAHPRGYGTYPRVLGLLVREEGRLALEEAVHKMTGLAAEHVGLVGRGTIVPGAPADLVLFDPETVVDRATPAAPQATSEGIHTVWVAGEQVYSADSGPTSARPGVVIRRPS